MTTTRCECGEWSGERCEHVDVTDNMAVVEFVPEHLRDSHVAAGNRGHYPLNGSKRILVCSECAALMVESDGDWCELLGQ